MNILIFAHTTDYGGAERALFDLVSLLIPKHQVSVMFPSSKGVSVDKFREAGVKCGVIPIDPSLPAPFETLLKICDPKIEDLIRSLKKSRYDLIICNTITTLHGAVIAQELKIACITYAHEFLPDESDLIPHGCSDEFYLDVIRKLSNHLLCASEYVKSSFKDNKKCSVLYPFTPYQDIKTNCDSSLCTDQFHILVIGSKSKRKNSHFAITVLKALRLRGVLVNLHIIGSENSGSYKLNQQAIIRDEDNFFIHSHLDDPYSISGKKINLVCSLSEPFGLTIPESLLRGIPVVSSKCGGPEEILPPALLYDVNDIDSCVRVIEAVVKEYDHFSAKAREQYLELAEKNNIESRRLIVNQALERATQDFQANSNESDFLNVDSFKRVLNPPISFDQIVENISTVSNKSPFPLSTSQVRSLVNAEIQTPGSAVMRDIQNFDVVPFGYSENMEHLYKNGLGLAAELLANLENIGKQHMLAYIVLRLDELRKTKPNLKILSLGDGLGVDSIVLASCGFNIEYIDFDKSLMSQCAELNFKTAAMNFGKPLSLSILLEPSSSYDAIISLEVIEHVSDPKSFMRYISNLLIPGGLLFMSECFDGIYDRWPTHLYSNERYASILPVLAAPYFKLLDINTHPIGKPYLFSKNVTDKIEDDALIFFDHPNFFGSMGNGQIRIGF
ncbi:glycosyltransferase [Polynucleobacter sp. MWH-Jannik1A5]|uniref:glycosyltransferase n=1 Tax=Polynucleobacter sp. MWH-Jannik1A5 TaxID=1855890 RepID=UPI001C0C61FA|nr:glycosyltransferase [Polynucleobacter sp. MWH-Jannik1A5]MBU3546530.1 glycosyltransferase [Polynucleobacter sp. MWH-Jannik1A5]